MTMFTDPKSSQLYEVLPLNRGKFRIFEKGSAILCHEQVLRDLNDKVSRAYDMDIRPFII